MYGSKEKMAILNKKIISREDRFFLGLDKYENILSSMSEKERGRIKDVRDLLEIEKMFQKKYSLIEIAERYNLPNRAAVCKALGIECAAYNRSEEVIVPATPKRRYFKPSDDLAIEIGAAYERGVPTVALARQYGVSTQSIRYILRKLGVQMEGGARKGMPRLLKAEANEIDIYYNRGYSPAAIADVLHLDSEQVVRYIKRTYKK